ncbi:MAG: hypothetical protein JWS10_2527 [Cypionkella sp.]|uniref:hypothetical protein n=1 Tax=Cypionkella sp. TaxID=2811411 RepID=UPI00261E9EC2|nr:hypothetical protein [Cypionkella sp.]MDB5659912.1 hypothetical protein [Cypionkella sp.]
MADRVPELIALRICEQAAEMALLRDEMCGDERRAQMGGAFMCQQAIGPSGEVGQASQEMRVAALVEDLQTPQQDRAILIGVGQVGGGQGFDLVAAGRAVGRPPYRSGFAG